MPYLLKINCYCAALQNQRFAKPSHRVVDILIDVLFQNTVRWPDGVSGIAEKFFVMGMIPLRMWLCGWHNR